MNSIRRKGLQKLSELLDLELSYSHAKHNFELGLPLESSLRHFFRKYFPARYGFSSGYIVDDHETVSNQTDWIIYSADHFSPLLAQIHGTEGAEWFPFDAIYGCVEVKRTLTESALIDAVNQIAITRKLKREKTGLLQITPYTRIPEKMLNIAPGAVFNEICNSLYIGIYAFLPGSYSDKAKLLKKIEELIAERGHENLPDFIAIHGHFYLRRAIVDGGSINIKPFIEQTDCYIAIDSGQLTSGVFYSDLIYQFANTHLSATVNTTGLGSFLKSEGLLKISGLAKYKDV